MAVDLPEVHARALEVTRRYVGGVDTPDWDKPSVCSEWNVRELVNHIVSGNLWVPELVGGKSIEDVGDRLDGDVLGADPVTAYESSEAVAAAAFRSPGAMDAPVAVSYGPVPGSVYCGHRFLDVLIHGWDVAESTGQDTHARSRAGRGVLGGHRAPDRPARRQRHVRLRRGGARGRRPPDGAARPARPPGLTPAAPGIPAPSERDRAGGAESGP